MPRGDRPEEIEPQEVFERFIEPLIQEELTPAELEHAEILIEHLWLALIGGRQMEAVVWYALRDQEDISPESIDALQMRYLQEMKRAVTAEELAALRRRYGLSKNPAAVEIYALRDTIFRDVHLELPRRETKSIVRTFLKTGMFGGLYGTAVGSVIGAFEYGTVGALIGGTALAVAAGFFGFWPHFDGDRRHRVPWDGLVGAVFCASVGGSIGFFSGTMVVAFAGSVPGAVLGAIAGRLLADPQRTLISTMQGGALGASLGGLAVAFLENGELARPGAVWGAFIGAVVAIMLVIMLGTIKAFGGFPDDVDDRQSE